MAYLGKKGSVTELLKGLKSVAGDQKKEMGQLINQLKRQVEEGIAQQVETIRAAEEERQIASAEQCRCHSCLWTSLRDLIIPSPWCSAS